MSYWDWSPCKTFGTTCIRVKGCRNKLGQPKVEQEVFLYNFVFPLSWHLGQSAQACPKELWMCMYSCSYPVLGWFLLPRNVCHVKGFSNMYWCPCGRLYLQENPYLKLAHVRHVDFPCCPLLQNNILLHEIPILLSDPQCPRPLRATMTISNKVEALPDPKLTMHRCPCGRLYLQEFPDLKLT